MISADKGKVIIKGTSILIVAELAVLLRGVKEAIGEEAYEYALKEAKMTEEELRDEANRELDKLIEMLMGGLRERKDK